MNGTFRIGDIIYKIMAGSAEAEMLKRNAATVIMYLAFSQ